MATNTAIKIKTNTAEDISSENKYAVIFHNDDFTPMEYVVMMLMMFFEKNIQTASDIMLSVHKNGRGIAGIYDIDSAYARVDAVEKCNEEIGMSLVLTVEEV